MKMTMLTVLGIAVTLLPSSLDAGETIFGHEGSGRPTNTIVGALFGAATGAAIGQATGGEDGWWIGSLVGTAVGGTVGNTLPTKGHYSHSQRTYRTNSTAYQPRFKRSYYAPRNYCEPVAYTAYTREVVVQRPVIIEEAPVVVESTSPPYGYLQQDQLKSPWSEFSMNVGGLTSGQIVYDGLTGKAFKVP